MKKLIPRNVALLVDAAADHRDHRYSLRGVRVRLNESGYIAEATNGRILVRLEGEYSMQADEFPHVIPDVADEGLEGIIPVEALVAVGKRKMGLSRWQDQMAVNIGRNEAVLMVVDLEKVAVERTRLVEGYFPDTEKVWPDKAVVKGMATTNLAPQLLLKLVKLLAKLMEEPKGRAAKNMDFTPRLEWEFRGKEEPVVVRGVTALGQKLSALIMPLT